MMKRKIKNNEKEMKKETKWKKSYKEMTPLANCTYEKWEDSMFHGPWGQRDTVEYHGSRTDAAELYLRAEVAFVKEKDLPWTSWYIPIHLGTKIFRRLLTAQISTTEYIQTLLGEQLIQGCLSFVPEDIYAGSFLMSDELLYKFLWDLSGEYNKQGDNV